MQLFCFITNKDYKGIAVKTIIKPCQTPVPETKHQGVFIPVQSKIELGKLCLTLKVKGQGEAFLNRF